MLIEMETTQIVSNCGRFQVSNRFPNFNIFLTRSEESREEIPA
jgi:hypothetical protein